MARRKRYGVLVLCAGPDGMGYIEESRPESGERGQLPGWSDAEAQVLLRRARERKGWVVLIRGQRHRRVWACPGCDRPVMVDHRKNTATCAHCARDWGEPALKQHAGEGVPNDRLILEGVG